MADLMNEGKRSIYSKNLAKAFDYSKSRKGKRNKIINSLKMTLILKEKLRTFKTKVVNGEHTLTKFF